MNTPEFSRAIVCKHCGLVNDYKTRQNGKHLEAICNGCDKHIKFLPQAEPMLYIGKYKGIPIKDIEDLNYLQWVVGTLRMSESVRDAVQARIRQLSLTHR
jgi:hypothetical protein